MASLLIKNIKKLVNAREEYHLLRGKELSALPCIDNAYLLIEDDTIAEYGPMSELKTRNPKPETRNTLDATDQFILPAWCDSHTHLVLLPAEKMNSSIK